MVRSKLTAYIGFAARARKLKSGDFTCEKLMKQKKVQLMLLDSGVSANTREKYEAMCSAAEIDCLYIEDLGRLIGKEGQNARLAAKLTGWKIDIKSQSQAEEELDRIDLDGMDAGEEPEA